MCEVRDLTGAESKKSTGRFLKLHLSVKVEISSWDDQDRQKKSWWTNVNR